MLLPLLESNAFQHTRVMMFRCRKCARFVSVTGDPSTATADMALLTIRTRDLGGECSITFRVVVTAKPLQRQTSPFMVRDESKGVPLHVCLRRIALLQTIRANSKAKFGHRKTLRVTRTTRLCHFHLSRLLPYHFRATSPSIPTSPDA